MFHRQEQHLQALVVTQQAQYAEDPEHLEHEQRVDDATARVRLLHRHRLDGQVHVVRHHREYIDDIQPICEEPRLPRAEHEADDYLNGEQQQQNMIYRHKRRERDE